MNVDPMPQTRYAESGDLSIAYMVYGDGPVDIVFISGFISHLELSWEFASAQSVRRLARSARMIWFDKRGTGLSDRSLGFGSAEDRMDDIRAVMDAAGSERAALIGLSEGGPLALLFAATYPERVSRLVIWDSYARLLRDDDYDIGFEPELARGFGEAIAQDWGTGDALAAFFGIRNLGDEQRAMLARYERNSATPKLVREIMESNVAIDVRTALPAIAAPTLVVHRAGDPLIPASIGRYIADHVAGAQYVELPGDFHHAPAEPGAEDDAVDAMAEFLTGRPVDDDAEIDRVLATVLFVDIVDSTRHAADLGDRRWRELLDSFRAVTRREVARYRGREVNTRGDDILAMFDGPGRAIKCARAIGAAARPLGLDVRAGLHTGEVELQGDDIAGIAVHIGARVAGLAGAGDVLVTSTVRDLVTGSGIEFVDRGSHALKGVPGEWRIMAATS